MAEDILLEKINRGDSDDEASRKILENDTRLKTSVLSAHKKAEDNTKAIENLEKGIDDSKTEKKEYLNISLFNNIYDYANKTTARNAVPDDMRALGQKITYCVTNEGWKTEQFVGTDLEQWIDPLFWREESAGAIYSLGRADTVFGDVQVIDCGGADNNSDRIIDCGGAENHIK